MKKKNSQESNNFRKYTKRHLKKEKGMFSSSYLWISKLNVVTLLILINVVIFVILYLFGVLSDMNCEESICKYVALNSSNLFQGKYLWTLITSMFMHSGIFHLFVNMFSLYFIGNFLEMLIGRKRFFWLYLLSGIFAGVFFCFFSFLFGNVWWGARIFGSSAEYALGASGAIFGVAGVLALLTPRNKVYLIAGPLVAIIIQAFLYNIIQSQTILSMINILITIYVLVAIFSLVSFNFSLRRIAWPIEMPFWLLPIVAIVPLVVVGFFIRLPIGNMAHLGGFLAGACYGVYLRLRYKKKTQAIDDYFARR